jgi:hypothetical protein
MKERVKKYPCPCCGFITMEEELGSYHICEVCGWEDDDIQLKYPAMRIGANGQNFIEYQWIVKRCLPVDIKEHLGWIRDSDWRPLTREEIEKARKQTFPVSGEEYFKAVCENNTKYYWK